MEKRSRDDIDYAIFHGMFKDFKRATRRQERAIENGIGYYIHKPEELHHFSSYVMYKFLKKHFGKTQWPRWNDEDRNDFRDKTQWAYVVRMPHGLLSIQDYKRIYCVYRAFRMVSNNLQSIEGNRSGNDLHSTLPADLQEDINNFYNAVSNFERSIVSYDRLARRSHAGFIIINAFQLHFENANYHIHRLRNIERKWNKVRLNYYKSWKLSNEMEYISQVSFLLLMASVEGFINLLYQLYLKDSIRGNQELVNRLSREQLIFKIKLLSLYCNGFREYEENDTFRAFNKLQVTRNKLIHANIDDIDYRNLIEEDSFLFYLNRETSNLGSSKSNPMTFTVEDIVSKRQLVLDMIRSIMSLMERDARKKLKTVLHDYYIGYVARNREVTFVQHKLDW